MPKKIKSIVVDASVARAANDKVLKVPPNPPATAYWPLLCAQFLKGMLEGRYIAVFSETLNEEWNKHRSVYSTKWQLGMTSRKLIRYVRHTDPLLEKKVQATQTSDKEKNAMKKDFHLIEAALASDQTIVSLDDTVRGLFSQAAQSVGEIRKTVWGNPGKPDEELLQWLQSGAPVEAKRQLGYGGNTPKNTKKKTRKTTKQTGNP